MVHFAHNGVILVACGVAATAGCASVESTGNPDAELQTEAAALTPATLNQTCPGTHWVGRKESSGDCPDAGGSWHTEELFGDDPPARLRGYCLYSHPTSAGPVTAKVLAELPSDGSRPAWDWLDRDCMAVAPMGTTDDVRSVLLPTLQSAYMSQIEAPPSMPSGATTVRVAILDSWPSASPAPGQLRHGFGMGALVDDIACGAVSGPCSTKIVHRLALNLEGPDQPNELLGGYAGYLHRLAAKILETVELAQAQGPTDRLVINLSLGWDGRFGLDASGNLTAPAQAVRAAIEEARCDGALVIAAAGNDTGGPSPSAGPIYPAAWEREPAPACATGGGPLVYAVGGVDGRDEALRSGRPGGRPRLAAPGFFAMTSAPAGGKTVLLGPYTGTSVSAAAVSGIAGAVWSQHGALTPAAVMKVIYGTGEELADQADFCLSPPCGKIRRASLCRAVDAVGAGVTCAPIAAHAGENPVVGSHELDHLVSGPFDATVLDTSYHPAVCSQPVLVPAQGTSATDELLCASEHVYAKSLSPLVEPQPEPDPCGACTLDTMSHDPLIDIAVNARVASIVYPQTLLLYQAGVADPVQHLDLGSARVDGVELRSGLAPGQVVRVDLPEITTSFDSAAIEWVYDPVDPRTVSVSEVLVGQ